MAVWCPITQEKVVYLYCQECNDKVCKKQTKPKDITEGETDERLTPNHKNII